jgi:TatD DNase family protein
MVPANIYESLSPPTGKSSRLALSHSGMIPWTAAFVAEVVNEAVDASIDANDVLDISRANAHVVYGV